MADMIRITPEEHAAAIADPDGMSKLFSRMFALMITAFWKGAFPILKDILLDAVPKTMTLSGFLSTHPELEQSEPFAKAIEDIKKADPNITLRDLLQRAMEQMNHVEEATNGQTVG